MFDTFLLTLLGVLIAAFSLLRRQRKSRAIQEIHKKQKELFALHVGPDPNDTYGLAAILQKIGMPRVLPNQQKGEELRNFTSWLQGFMAGVGMKGDPKDVLRDVLTIPEKELTLAGDFGNFLAGLLEGAAQRDPEQKTIQIYPVSILPAPASDILRALLTIAKNARSDTICFSAIGCFFILLFLFDLDEDVQRHALLSEEEFQARRLAILKQCGLTSDLINGPWGEFLLAPARPKPA